MTSLETTHQHLEIGKASPDHKYFLVHRQLKQATREESTLNFDIHNECNFNDGRSCSYLRHHGSELDAGGEEEGDEEDVVGGEGGAPLPQGPQVEAQREQRRHQDQNEEDRPLVTADEGGR